MTTTQAFSNPGLSVDSHEDRMEMATSPYREPHDDDIDFELDDDQDQSIEDNSMIDDFTVDTSNVPYQDDVMFDEDDNELLDFDQDLPMDPDDTSYTEDQVVDEELENASAQYSPIDNPVSQPSIDDHVPTTGLAQEKTTQDEEIKNRGLKEQGTNQESTLVDNPAHDSLDSKSTEQDLYAKDEENVPVISSTAVVDFATDDSVQQNPLNDDAQAKSVEEATDEESTMPAEVGQDETETIEALANELHQSTSGQKSPEEVLGDIEQSSHRESSPETLHPVTTRYNGEDCWLFPPLETSDVRHIFLQDLTLASRPFNEMLAAIRPSLIENGEMADHDEIVFEIPALGLHICEDSKHASKITLSRVIDMYMMLSQNEGLTEFEPIFCELSTRVCLADQIDYLEDAAFSRRLTYTEFVAEQAGTPEEVPHENEATGQNEVQAEVLTHFDESNHHVDDDGGEGEANELENGAHGDDERHDAAQHSTEFHTVDGTEPLQPTDVADVDGLAQEERGKEDTVFEGDEAPAQDEPLESSDDKQPSTAQAHANAPEQSKAPATLLEVEGTVETAEEDLFADDGDDDTAEDALVDAADSTLEGHNIPTLVGDDVEPSPPNEDDLDFDNWSDDEDHNSTLNADKTLTTPSKSLNGKRKLLDDEDDFLELDVSTPEPKRSRAS